MQTLSQNSSSKIFYSVGSGGSGQLLLGDKEDYYHFRKINFDELFSEEKENALDFQQNIKTLVLGGTIGLALTQKGEVYSWGEYFEKQILVNISPVKIISNPIVIEKISCGWNHNLCLTSDNKLYAWGEAKFGQLGLGNNFNTYLKQPVLVDIKNIENKIKEIYAGFRQSYILLADSSSILVSGSNKFLELGIKSDKNTLFDFETLSIISESKLIKLSIGQKHALSLDENGCVYGWGSNKYGQLGIENTNQENCYLPMKLNIQDVKDFSSGWSHNLFLTNNNKLFSCGRGDFGQQASGTKDHSFKFHEIQIPIEIKAFCCASEACYALTENDLYVWGWNEHGNLATGDREDRLQPESLKTNIINPNTEISTGGAALIIYSDEVEKDKFKMHES